MCITGEGGWADTPTSMLPGISRKRKMRSKFWWFTGFCNSHYVSHFAAFFIDVGAKTSVAESCIEFPSCPRRRFSAAWDSTQPRSIRGSRFLSLHEWRQIDVEFGVLKGVQFNQESSCFTGVSLRSHLFSFKNEKRQKTTAFKVLVCRMILPQVHLR